MVDSPSLPPSGFPHTFYLSAQRPADLATFLTTVGQLAPGERVLAVERAGDGNMNCTVRVLTDRGSFIVKQSRPWVEKYPQFAAPWDRTLREAEFYRLVSLRPEVAKFLPQIRAVDPDARVLILEDLGAASDYTGVYRGDVFTRDEVQHLGRFLSALHHPGAEEEPRDLTNREMRQLNHAHIFEIPLQPANGLDLDALTPGLAQVAHSLKKDPRYCRETARLGREAYLSDGPSLLHGDFFPGSLLRTPAGPRVIDPEFGFFGRPEFDAAVFLAHLTLSGQSTDLAPAWRSAYAAPSSFDDALMRQLTGVEIMRRLIGYAQLPVGYGLARKQELLELSRDLVLEPRVHPLLPV
ncbi:MAG: phosphotransferase [Verrucomicrobia bacterium]|nr:phosphotransferase [Verrucomicrobiota bacterium]